MKEGGKERQKAKVKTERLLILKRKKKEDMHNVQIVAKAAFLSATNRQDDFT